MLNSEGFACLFWVIASRDDAASCDNQTWRRKTVSFHAGRGGVQLGTGAFCSASLYCGDWHTDRRQDGSGLGRAGTRGTTRSRGRHRIRCRPRYIFPVHATPFRLTYLLMLCHWLEEEDVFESDFASTDDEAAQEDVDEDKTVQEAERRERKVRCVFPVPFVVASRRHDPSHSLDCPCARRKSHRSCPCTPAGDVQPRSDILATEVAGDPKAQTPRLPGCRCGCRNWRGHSGRCGYGAGQEAQSEATYDHEYLGNRESYQGRRGEAGTLFLSMLTSAVSFMWMGLPRM
jgi:hypothetical protein